MCEESSEYIRRASMIAASAAETCATSSGGALGSIVMKGAHGPWLVGVRAGDSCAVRSLVSLQTQPRGAVTARSCTWSGTAGTLGIGMVPSFALRSTCGDALCAWSVPKAFAAPASGGGTQAKAWWVGGRAGCACVIASRAASSFESSTRCVPARDCIPSRGTSERARLPTRGASCWSRRRVWWRRRRRPPPRATSLPLPPGTRAPTPPAPSARASVQRRSLRPLVIDPGELRFVKTRELRFVKTQLPKYTAPYQNVRPPSWSGT